MKGLHYNLILYSINNRPMRLIGISQSRCLDLLREHLKAVRSAADFSRVVAEVEVASGALMWFSTQDGEIIANIEVPRFNIPLLSRIRCFRRVCTSVLVDMNSLDETFKDLG